VACARLDLAGGWQPAAARSRETFGEARRPRVRMTNAQRLTCGPGPTCRVSHKFDADHGLHRETNPVNISRWSHPGELTKLQGDHMARVYPAFSGQKVQSTFAPWPSAQHVKK
jgi:hypothetical protein